jgi:hypothetical protein
MTRHQMRPVVVVVAAAAAADDDDDADYLHREQAPVHGARLCVALLREEAEV